MQQLLRGELSGTRPVERQSPNLEETLSVNQRDETGKIGGGEGRRRVKRKGQKRERGGRGGDYRDTKESIYISCPSNYGRFG